MNQLKKEETNENLLELQKLIEYCESTKEPNSYQERQNSTNLILNESSNQDQIGNDYLLNSMNQA